MRYKKWFVPVLFVLVMAAVTWLAVADDSPVRLKGSQNDTMLWETGWQVEEAGGSLRSLSMPQRLGPGETVVVNTLPEALQANLYVYIKTDYQQVTAQVDGAAVPVSGIASGSGGDVAYDLPWSRLALTPDMAGKSMRLTFSNTGSKPWVEIYTVRLGEANAIQLSLLSRSIPSIIISLFILLIALFLFAFAMLEANRHRMHVPRGYSYLMVFILISGIWFYTDTDISGVSFIGSRSYYYVTVISYLLMPVPYFMFIASMRPSLRRPSQVLGGLLILNTLVELAILQTGLFQPWAGVISSHVILLASCVLMLFLVIPRKKRTLNVHAELSVGVAITSVAGIVALALFYLLPIEDNASAFRYGVVALGLTLTISAMRANVDIIVQSRRMEQLRIREEEYRIAVRQSDKYVLRFDVGSRTLLRGEEASPLFNTDQDLPDMPDSFIAAGNVAEESIADIRIFFDDMIAGKPSGSCAVSLRNHSGGFPWYRIDYTMIYSSGGTPLQAIVSFYDITEQHQKELAYQKWKQRYADMPSGSMSLYEFNLTRDTPVAEAGGMLPLLPEEVRHSFRTTVDFLAAQYVLRDDSRRFHAFLERDRLLEAFGHGVRSDRLEFRRVDGENRARWTIASVQLIADPYSGDAQFSLLLQDEDEAKRNELKVRDRSNSDPLTGLLNRAAFEEQLTLLLEQTDPSVMHALLMIDLDGFKRVNDTFGHQFGDRVLSDIANSLRAMMRNDDLIGRVGGDEFMVCLRNVRDNSGFLEKRASFICQALNMKFSNDVAISGSVGIALYPRDGRTFGTLYQKADKALYYSKHRGKNRFTFYRNDLPTNADAVPSTPSPFPDYDEEYTDARIHADEKRTLLIADDAEESVNALQEIFRADYRLLTVTSGEHACTCCARARRPFPPYCWTCPFPVWAGWRCCGRCSRIRRLPPYR